MAGNDPTSIEWRVHLSSPPDRVYKMLTTDDGRAQFWAESAIEEDGVVHFIFPNGVEERCRILDAAPATRFEVEYFGGIAAFELNADGGTDLTLRHQGLDREAFGETRAGWVSVLLSLKAAVDHGTDLRNHDPQRTWDDGYVDN